MPFVVPVVVVRHLRERKPALCLMREIQIAADAGMFFQALQNPEDVRDPKGAMVKRKKNLRTEMSSNVIDEVLGAVVLIGIAR